MLEETPEALASRLPPPAWAREFHEIFQSSAPCTEAIEAQLERGNWWRQAAWLGWPLLVGGIQTIDEFMRATVEYREIPHDALALRTSLLDLLSTRMAHLCVRTLVYEAHERGIDFPALARELRSRAAVWAMLHKYPVLARDLMRVYHDSLQMIGEVLQRLVTDWVDLPFARGRIERVKATGSDPHHHGREVLRLEAEGTTLIYKPRSCAADELFYRRLLPFIEPSFDPELVRLSLRDGYAWMSFVDHAPCGSQAELHEFFRRSGRLLALSYFMGITDLHCENIIACGAIPVPIDVETILHPESIMLGAGLDRADAKFSVFDTMLVPGVHRGMAADMAGFARLDRRPTQPLPKWEYVEGEAPRIVDRPTVLPPQKNLPRLSSSEQVHAEQFHQALSAGLEEGYREATARREELEDVLREFAELPLRVVIRPTAVYMQLLADSRHPSLLSDALQRDCWMLQIGTSDPEEPVLFSALPAEWRALSRGDVPVFWSRGGGRELFTHGEPHRVAYLPLAGAERARSRLRSPPPLQQMQWQLRSGLALGGRCPLEGPERGPRWRASSSDPLAKARAVGDALLDLAVTTDRGGLDWLTVRRESSEVDWEIHVLGPDLYGGTAGIALFLLYLARATSDAAYRAHGERSLWEAHLRWKSASMSLRGGGYMGAGSLLYAMMHAHALGVPWAEGAVEELVDYFAGAPTDEPGVRDVLYGDAGLLLVVLRLIAHRRGTGAPVDERLTKLARALADRITQTASAGEDGALLWQPGPSFGQVWLCGLSHGASGVALALAEAARVLDSPALRPYVSGALRYEDQRFDAAAETWLNPISEDAAAVADGLKRDMCSWCNGAPGIGLVRLMLRADEHYTDLRDQVSRDLERSLHAIELGLPALTSDCLCHGQAGTLEVAFRLWEALRPGPPPTWMTDSLARLESKDVSDYACSTPYRITTPELMTGIAGVGMFWLRVADRRAAPCVMTLEGPC
ncbi:type 2 lanthipeptide synthetase LanM [Nannocystis sp. SCPEA4]|uniref:type 2 lanthipeptide synthetase LanM n=1 Tax=Nannocystis sp. SCPEA4 TaxID=2996787 RepID=UPI00226F0640|nr:type 2 lanthipeptide synthetase LanM [Nannocystis sp. SCPEA4]MCY1060383.1 type 2 lanthipeptide synthetase LanM [Nannocystis sp. SCPEA4]